MSDHVHKKPNCWICDSPAHTREHTINKSVLKLIMGKPLQAKPFRFHDENGVDQLLRGFESNLLKPGYDLCENCNTAVTQPHDQAFNLLVEWLLACDPPLPARAQVDPCLIYPIGTLQRMIDLHLFCVKKFGCLVREGLGKGKPLNVDLTFAASAIQTGVACPHVYFRVGRRPINEPPIGRSIVTQVPLLERCVGLDFVIYFGPYALHVIFAEETLNGSPILEDSWHPAMGLKPLILIFADKAIKLPDDVW